MSTRTEALCHAPSAERVVDVEHCRSNESKAKHTRRGQVYAHVIGRKRLCATVVAIFREEVGKHFRVDRNRLINDLRIALADDVSIHHTPHLRATFANPAVELVDAGVDTHEVDTRKVHRIAVAVDSPVDIDFRAFVIIAAIVEVRLIVGIAIVESRKHIVRLRGSALVFGVVGQTNAVESQRRCVDPLRPIVLLMVYKSVNNTATAVVVSPADCLRRRSGTGIGSTVVELRIAILTTGNFKPFVVVGLAVAVYVVSHPNHARLGTSGVSRSVREGVALDVYVALARHVNDGALETYGDRTAPPSERDDALVDGHCL